MSGTHRHKCDACGSIWEHSNRCAGDPAAHTCKQCGKQQWLRYFGEPPLAAIDILTKILTQDVSRETETAA